MDALFQVLVDDKSIYHKEQDLFYVVLRSESIEGKRSLLMDRLVSSRGIENIQDNPVISQVLLFFLRLAYLQKEEDLSLNYICT